MRIEKRQQEIVNEFQSYSDWESKYKHLIEVGKRLPSLNEEFRRDDLKVKGCQSSVWLHASLNSQGEIEFAADSDALIVKGLVALVLKVYGGATPDEILSSSPWFIEKIGLAQNLTPSRANGLLAVIKQIKYYAAAFKALANKS